MNKYIRALLGIILMCLGAWFTLSISTESAVLMVIIFIIYYAHNYFLFKVFFDKGYIHDKEEAQLVDFIKDVMTNKDGDLREYITDDFCNNFCEYRAYGECTYSMMDEADYCYYMDDKKLFNRWLKERELK